MAYSWGLMSFSLVKVLAPGYFARQDTKATGARRPDRAGGEHGDQHVRRAAARYMGFPVAHILFSRLRPASRAAVNALLLWRGLRRQGVLQPRRLGRGCCCAWRSPALVMAALLWWHGASLDAWLAYRALERVWHGLRGVVAGRAAVFRGAVRCWACAWHLRDLRAERHERLKLVLQRRQSNVCASRRRGLRAHHWRLRWPAPRASGADRAHLRAGRARSSLRHGADLRAAAA